MRNFKGNVPSDNFILAALDLPDYDWLQPRLEGVTFQQGDVLHGVREEVTHVYFPTTCMLSWTNATETGDMVEVGITGNEGFAGLVLFLGESVAPWQIEVELPGQALKLPAADFLQVLSRSAAFQRRVAAFTYLKMVQLNQSALCNRFHSVEERLCRWLLVAQDHSEASKFSFTREILAKLIGAGRPTVSLATGILQSAGLIRTNRGEITILDRAGMKEAACECYTVVRRAFDHYLTQR